MEDAKLEALRRFADGRPWVSDAGGYKVDGVSVPDAAWWPIYLKEIAAQARRLRVDSGLTVWIGARQIPVWTDSDSRSALVAAATASIADPNFSTKWKGSDGAFYSLNASEVGALGTAVLAHVADAFGREASAITGIEAGTLTTADQVRAVFS